jgi:phage-related protein
VPDLKPIEWMGDSLTRLRAEASDVRSKAGDELRQVQQGRPPSDFKPMPDVGPGVMEIRVHGTTEFRVFYVARFAEAIYVLHSFTKKTQATRKADMDAGRRRYSLMMTRRSIGGTL